MKKNLVLAIALGAVATLSSCKSSESAYRQAYEKAQAQENQARANETETQTVVATNPTQNTHTVAVQPTNNTETNADVRTISGGMTVISGSGIKAYSVVVGSFSAQANAEGLQATLKNKGYSAQIVKTNETINGITGWYRVIATTYEDKSSAVQSRNQLESVYPGAWLLYNK